MIISGITTPNAVSQSPLPLIPNLPFSKNRPEIATNKRKKAIASEIQIQSLLVYAK